MIDENCNLIFQMQLNKMKEMTEATERPNKSELEKKFSKKES